VELVVKDTGTGMSPEVMERIFDPFFTTREVGKGTGMGLAVVYGIVRNLQGFITVESRPGIGSTFRVLLPKVKSEAIEDPFETVQIVGGTEHILFVDDEELLVDWGRAALERLGYTVTVLTDPTEALKTFSADPSRFHLVITDQTMPKLTGMSLARKILALRPDIPVILCTGHSVTVSPEKVKEAGIKKFLMKPVRREELARGIRMVLDAGRSNNR
jgi:CheY-like chemotaxis protein